MLYTKLWVFAETPECDERAFDNNQKRRAALKEKGLCPSCGKERRKKSDGTYAYTCEKCYADQYKAKRAIRRKIRLNQYYNV